ncbi:hypothetical protein Tco_0725461 [Tanacetum coccineum]|uniref:Reverse transcriptase domain-containing protein n=1 Tax=Tanacetum coccineum TaxID=301880 RepID=A0ABQ4YF48_9ASTR
MSQHSESRTPNVRGEHGRGRRSGRSRSISGSPEPANVFSRIRRGRSESHRNRLGDKGRKEGGVFGRMRGKGKNMSARLESCYQNSHSRETKFVPRKRHNVGTYSRRTEVFSKSEDSRGGNWKSRSKKKKSSIEKDDLSQPWAFLANFLQQKKCTKDPVEIHHVKQREGESTEEFVQRFKAKSRHVRGAPECMRISGFMHLITNPKLIKHLHDKISKSVDEMMRVTTSFLRGEVATSNQARKKALPAWKQQEPGRKQNFDKRGDFQNQQRSERRRDKFMLLTKSLREILALDKGKFKTSPPMTTPVEKRNNNKFCEFHGEVRHNTDECMHLKRQIEELIKAGKLSHVIKELKQGSEKDQPKAEKKEEAYGKDKAMAILMVQPWQRVASQRIT